MQDIIISGPCLCIFVKQRIGQADLPDFFNIGEPLSKAAADELRSVQKDFDVIDEEMWK